MNEFYSMIEQEGKEKSPRISKKEYAEKMKYQKNTLYEMSNKQALKVAADTPTYLDYLTLLSCFGYTVTNTLLVMAQKPEASLLKDSENWRKSKCYIKKGEKGIQILEPKGEYERNDGTIGTSYAIKYVFDISQISSNVKNDRQYMSAKNIFRGLLYESTVALKNSDMPINGQNVFYSSSDSTIYYCSNLSENELLEGIIREFCYAEFDQQYADFNRKRDQFVVESAAFILCRKLGVHIQNNDFASHSPQYFTNMNAKEIKEELSNIKNLFQDVYDRVEKGMYKTQQNSINKNHHSKEAR